MVLSFDTYIDATAAYCMKFNDILKILHDLQKMYNVMLYGALYHFYAERLLFSVCISLIDSEQNPFNLNTATMAATKHVNVYRFLKVTSEVLLAILFIVLFLHLALSQNSEVSVPAVDIQMGSQLFCTHPLYNDRVWMYLFIFIIYFIIIFTFWVFLFVCLLMKPPCKISLDMTPRLPRSTENRIDINGCDV